MERNTKLVPNFALGRRSQATTDAFIEGLRAAASSQRFQITTAGFKPYISAITYHASRPLRLRPTDQGVRRVQRSTSVQPTRRHACGEGPSHGQSRQELDLHEPH